MIFRIFASSIVNKTLLITKNMTNMKKFYLIAAMAVATLAANAQEKFNLSTYTGTNIEKYDGKVCNVTVNRLMFKGWNTIALPFAMSETELNEVFGSDCRLEKLIGADMMGETVQLNFQDCKASGMQANTPYILYYTGETATKKIAKEATIFDRRAELSYTVNGSAETVTMAGVEKKIDGVGFYGVMAIDNADAKFVQVSPSTNGFYATRCYVQLSSGTFKTLSTAHFAANETTSIQGIASERELVDVYNVAGAKIASQVRASEVSKLQKGIYMVKGKKILVK